MNIIEWAGKLRWDALSEKWRMHLNLFSLIAPMCKPKKRLELSSQLAAIKEVSIQHVGPSQMESVLCVKHGALVVAQLQQDL